MDKDPTVAVERKTYALITRSSLAEEVAELLLYRKSRPCRLYGLQKLHKKRVPLRTTADTIGAPTYGPAAARLCFSNTVCHCLRSKRNHKKYKRSTRIVSLQSIAWNTV
jgi:hypothetical protein